MIKKFDKILDSISYYGLVIAVSLMLSLTVLNIGLRWFNSTFLWIDPLVRHLVFLSTFLGGSLATGNNSHIRVDLAGKLLDSLNRPHLTVWIDRFVYVVCIISTTMLTKSGFDFAMVEFEYGKEAFLGIHSGFLVCIIPIGMGLILLRFVNRLIFSFSNPDEMQVEQLIEKIS